MRAESDTDFPSIIPVDLNCGEYSECFDRPVTESVMARAADTEVILCNVNRLLTLVAPSCIIAAKTIS